MDPEEDYDGQDAENSGGESADRDENSQAQKSSGNNPRSEAHTNRERGEGRKPEPQAKNQSGKPSGQNLKTKLNPKAQLKQKYDPRQKFNQAKEQLKSAGKDAVKKAAKNALKKGVTKLAANPYVLIAVGIILLIIFIILIATGSGAGEANPLSITKSGPTEAAAGEILPYQITINYAASAQEITITDRLPAGTAYESSAPPGLYDDAAKTVTWNLKGIVPPDAAGLISNFNTTLSLTLRATEDHKFLVNQAEGFATGEVLPDTGGGGGGPIDGNYLPPNQDNCGGKYSFKNATGNFGDPGCNFDKNALHEMLKTQDPANADRWFFKIVPCESGYNPNAYAPPSTGTPDGAGAWGLYQMGSSKPPGSPPPAPGKNGPNDRGDVPWPIQTNNATTYGKKISSLGAYWACAR